MPGEAILSQGVGYGSYRHSLLLYYLLTRAVDELESRYLPASRSSR